MKPKSEASTSDPYAPTKPNYVIEPWDKPAPSRRQKNIRRGISIGCSVLFAILICLVFVSSVYFLVPFRTNLLVLGIDRTPGGTDLGRSDTNILITIQPLSPYVGVLSIPRDLWVTIPGIGENRINAAHYFAEGEQPGSGPNAALETVKNNFSVPVNYYLRIKFDGIVGIVDAFGGLDVELDNPMGGLPPGEHQLTGEQALVFVRDRQGTDDFFRMLQGQFFAAEIIEQALQPKSWPKLPAVFSAVNESIDTNLPVILWPRLGFALLRAGPSGIDYHVINRDYVTPTTTTGGAQVLVPNWPLINPLVDQIFGD
ncbi:MAG: LCP family protein [Chloroflexota bacterium]|nr:MAG: LCP family protein [Chloroflexota bacterium]